MPWYEAISAFEAESEEEANVIWHRICDAVCDVKETGVCGREHVDSLKLIEDAEPRYTRRST